MVRGTGKFKQKRGGGRSFSKHMVLDENGTAVSTDKRWAKKTDGEHASDDDDDKEEDQKEEEEGEEEGEEGEGDEDESEEEGVGAGGSTPSKQSELTRAERRELKKQGAKKNSQEHQEEEDPDFINPNHVQHKLKISDLDAPRELSRREREQKEKKEAKDRYWKLHEEGKTEEAKSDLARLAKVRQDREAALAKRKAEAEAKVAEIEAKKKAAAAGKRI